MNTEGNVVQALKGDTLVSIEYYNSKLLKFYRDICDEQNFFSPYFEELHFKSVGIYGFGEIGEMVYKKLKMEQIEILWVMDQRKNSISLPEIVVDICDTDVMPVDIVITTLLNEEVQYNVIQKIRTKNISSKIISSFALYDEIFMWNLWKRNADISTKIEKYCLNENILNVYCYGEDFWIDRVHKNIKNNINFEKLDLNHVCTIADRTIENSIVLVFELDSFRNVEKEICSKYNIPVIRIDDFLEDVVA